MLKRHRRRRYRPQGSSPSASFAWIRTALLGIALLCTLLLFGHWLISKFQSSTIQKTSVHVVPENGTVSISVEGSEWRKIEGDIRIYAGDKASTDQNSHAILSFFDGSRIRLDNDTQVEITESQTGETEAQWSVYIEKGAVWVSAPTSKTFSGAIVRSIHTSAISTDIPAGTQAIIKEQSIAVFQNEGAGLSVSKNDIVTSIILGEGQSFSLTKATTDSNSLYGYRSALDPNAINSPFVQTSLDQLVSHTANTSTSSNTNEPVDNTIDTPLDVLAPDDKEEIDTSTVTVSGLVNKNVHSVLVNGYNADIQEDTLSFGLEIALPDKDEVRITVEAKDIDGEIVAQERRTIIRNRKPPEPPAFISPAKTGDTYQTQKQRLEIIGSAPADAVGIVVNDYRLQFFKPGDAKWKYLATIDLGNLKEGTNVLNAYSINKAGIQSEVASMTIVIGGDQEGIISTSSPSETMSSSPADTSDSTVSLEPENLPSNAPLQPGSLTISSPSNSREYTTNKTEEILEGTAPRGTESVWVNDYRLKLFNPEKRLWNYIASFDLSTLKRGRNIYTVTARNKEYQIIDSLTLVLTYEPR